jgi:hypothetical protein
MKFKTDLFCVDSRPQFGFNFQHQTTHWQLWFSEQNSGVYQPYVDEYTFPVKPTKRQVRKLRRAFRKLSTPVVAIPLTMPKALTVFDNKPVTGRTPHELWEAIQHGAIVCTDIDKQIASMRPANSDETCYVFWDECSQMSMPYASEAIAREALRVYAINL